MEPAESAAADAEIAEELQDVEGEVEVIVRFESVDRATLQASDDAVETLKTKSSTAQGPLQRYATRTEGVSVEQDFWLANAALVRVDTERVSLAELGRIDGVERIHENFEMEVQTGATRPASPAATNSKNVTTSSSDYTYGLEQVNASQVWNAYGTKGDGVKVAVLDTGVDVDHPDIDLYTENSSDPTYPGGWAEFDSDGNMVPDSEPYDSDKHGTHVTGTVSGGNDSGKWIGVAPEAETMHGLVLPGGGGSFAQITAGMQWAVDNNADVMSMSLGYPCDSDGPYYVSEFIDHVQNAHSNGTIVVAAIGNDGEGCSGSPGNVYDTLSVGASDANGGIGSFSSGEQVDTSTDWGTSAPDSWPDQYIVPDVAAPGVDVYSAIPGGDYAGTWDGTSMATPHVSGTIALMEAASTTELDPGTIKRTLSETAWKPDSWSEGDAQWQIDGNDSRYGAGIIDAHAATAEVASGTVNGTVTDAATGTVLDGATVTIESSEWTATTETDGSGYYEITDVPAVRDYNFTVEREGYETTNRTVTPTEQETTTKNVSLSGDSVLTGTVSDEASGAVLGDVTIAATSTKGTYETATGSDGTYTLTLPGDGTTYDLSIEADGYDSWAGAETLNGGEERLDATLTGDSALTGTVSDGASGAVLADVTISATSTKGTYETATGSDGTYTLTLPGNGTSYDLAIEASGYETWTAGETLNGSEVSLDAALTGDGNISLSLTETHFEEGVAGASITVANETYGEYPVVDDGDGNYTVSNVSSAGTYDIVVDATGYRSETMEGETVPEGGTATHNVSLAGNATIDGTLTDAYGETTAGGDLPIENATIEVTRPGANGSLTNVTDANGAYSATVPGIDASYTVTATATYYESTNLTTAALGDNASITVDLRAVGNATLSGTVNVTGVQTENATITATTNASGRDGAAWENDSTDENVSVAIPGTGGNYTVNATSRAFSTNSTTVEDVTTDADFGTLSIHQVARYLGVDDLTAPEEVEEGDEVTVEATIVNLGTDDWNETATFHVEGSEAGNRNVSLNGTDNASETGEPWANASVTFTHSPDSPGNVTYGIATANETVNATVAVDESSGGGIPLPPSDPEPSLYLVGTTLETDELVVGETGSVTVTVSNTGDAAGEQELALTHEGAVIDTATVSVPAGERAEATLAFAFDEPGTYDLAVDGDTVGSVDVTEAQSDPANESGETEPRNETESPADTTSSGDGLPGFGVPVAIVALLSVALASRRRR